MMTPVEARRVCCGSSKPEWYLFDAEGFYVRYWSEYHDGRLPENIRIQPSWRTA